MPPIPIPASQPVKLLALLISKINSLDVMILALVEVVRHFQIVMGKK